MPELAKDPDEWAKVMTIRTKAKRLTKKFQDNYITNKLGQVIDGTGKNFDRIKGHRKLYLDMGYDTYMVFVNTSLVIAQERNLMRERKLDSKMVEKMWKEVQDNLGKFQKLFGANRMLIVDNSEYGGDVLKQIEKQIAKHINKPVQNPLGKRWIQEELRLKKQ